MESFYVPEAYVGKTLKQIQKETGAPFRADVMGIGLDAPLTSGQQVSSKTDPGSAEYQFLSKYFTPSGKYQAQQSEAFSAKQKAEEESFMGALQGRVAGQEQLPAAAERIGGELELPKLRESTLNLVNTMNQIGGQVRDVPETQRTISKQVGISAPHLEKRIAAETGKLMPGLETAGRAATTALGAQQSAESQLGAELGYLITQQSKELRPFYEAQMPLLQDRLAREQSNYAQDKQIELDKLLLSISQGFQATQNDLTRANQLATAELGYRSTLDEIKFSTDEAIREATALKELKGTGVSDGTGVSTLSTKDQSARIVSET